MVDLTALFTILDAVRISLLVGFLCWVLVVLLACAGALLFTCTGIRVIEYCGLRLTQLVLEQSALLHDGVDHKLAHTTARLAMRGRPADTEDPQHVLYVARVGGLECTSQITEPVESGLETDRVVAQVTTMVVTDPLLHHEPTLLSRQRHPRWRGGGRSGLT